MGARMIWFLNTAIAVVFVELPAVLVGAAIYDWHREKEREKRLKAAGWKVHERDALDNIVTVLIWFFAVAAWVVSLGGVALGAWSEPYFGWLIGGSLAFGVWWLRERRRRSFDEGKDEQMGVVFLGCLGLSGGGRWLASGRELSTDSTRKLLS
jgi:ABC-type Fe3+ transport system permease subunit